MADLERTWPRPIGPPVDNPDPPTPEEATQPPPPAFTGVLAGDGIRPSHHIVLDDGVSEVGFVVSNSAGDLDERTFRRFPNADPVTPYITETQSEWTGGLGQATFEDDRSGYWRSEGVDTTKGAFALGPVPHYAEGAAFVAVGYMSPADGDKYDLRWLTGTKRYMAIKMVTPSGSSWTGGMRYLKIPIERTGKPGTLTIKCRTSSGGLPTNTALGTTTLAATALEEDVPQWVRIALTSSLLSSTTTYFITLEAAATDDSQNHWKVYGTDDGSQGTYHSTTGTGSWTQYTDFRAFGRIEGLRNPDDDFTAHFFEYMGQLYFVKSFDNWVANWELWMNGWRGAADAGVASRLTDATQASTWTSTYIKNNEIARMIGGPGTAEQEDYRFVTGTGSGYLTMNRDWLTTHTTDDSYVVLGSDYFFNISIPSTYNEKLITDVVEAKGIAFFCVGNQRQLLAHREYNKEGVWTNFTDAWQRGGTAASFAQVVNDPTGGQQLWLGRNPGDMRDTQPEVFRNKISDWADWALNWVEVTPIRQTEWTVASAHVVKEYPRANVVTFTVYNGKVLSVAVQAGGTGYANGNVLTLVETGSSGTATVTVTGESGGVVTTVSLTTAGYDYSTGVKTTTGGAGSNCTINVTGLTGFGTGRLFYTRLWDSAGDARSVDLRYMTSIGADIQYDNYLITGKANLQSLAAGELTMDLDDGTDASTPFVQLAFPLMKHDWYMAGIDDARLSMDIEDDEGASNINSVGFSLNQAKNYTFKLTLFYRIRAWNDILPVDVGGFASDNITSMNAYGEPENLWVFTEGGLGEIRNNRYYPVPIRELMTGKHPKNGKSSEVHDVYLMWTWRGRLQRYFRQNIEDLGPDFPASLADIAGEIVDMVTYPGRLYVAVDGGENGRSMVLVFKGGKWHEVFTGFAGERARKLYVQSLPGRSDKLWLSIGQSVMWFPITLDPVEPMANSNYQYTPFGFIQSSWVYTSKRELDKLWLSIVTIMDNAKHDDLTIRLWYQLDDEDGPWTRVSNRMYKSDTAVKHYISTGPGVENIRGNRIRTRILIKTNDPDITPVVRGVVHELYRIPDVKYSYSFLSKVSNIGANVRGDEEKPLGTAQTIAQAFQIIDGWSNNLVPLNVTTNIALLKGKTVVMEPVPTSLAMFAPTERIEEQIVQINLNDL